MNKMTFDQATKAKWVGIMQEHQDMDRLVQGSWLKDPRSNQKIHKGCFFGCAMQTENNPLDAAIKEMKLPEWLIYLAEKIFEGLPKEEAILFPVKLLSSIPVDADIESVRHKLAIKRLTRLIDDSYGDEVNNAIKLVIEYHKNPNEQLRSAAESVAESAARSVAESAARSVAESVARSVAESAAESVAESAWSAAGSAWSAAWSAWSAAESVAWIQECDDLIDLLSITK